MSVANEFVCKFIESLQLLILAVKRLGKVLMSLAQSLNIIDGALIHTDTGIMLKATGVKECVYCFIRNPSQSYGASPSI